MGHENVIHIMTILGLLEAEIRIDAVQRKNLLGRERELSLLNDHYQTKPKETLN